jgi:DNA-binding XRE family transcriptional regulator
MKEAQVGDFLATLAVIERGGSSVRSAAFPLNVDDENTEAKPRSLMTEDEKKGLKIVVLSLDGKAHDLQVGYVAESPVWKPSYRLVVAGNGEANLQAWGVVQNLSGEDWKDVKLSLVAGSPLAFEAQLGTPVIPQRPIVTDEGEVIAAVPKSETSLRQDQAPAKEAKSTKSSTDRDGDGIPDSVDRCPDQPENYNGVSDDDGCPDAAQVAGPRSKSAEVADAKKDSAARHAPSPATSRGKAGRGPTGGSAAADMDEESNMPGAPPPPPPSQAPSAPRNVRSLASIAQEGGTTRYDLPIAVTVPDKSATMVMLLSRKVPGEALFLFAPDGGVADSISHPFRVARFSNKTGGVLERGPIAVFEEGSFLGQGMVDVLPDGAAATVPFALERGLAVDREQKMDELGERIAKIENSELTIERDSVTKTTYHVRNGLDRPAKVLVKHARQRGSKLFDPPKETEDNVGSGTALVPKLVGPRTTADLVVDERVVLRRAQDWFSPIADVAVEKYINDSKSDRAIVAKLTAAWGLRTEIVTKTVARTKLGVEQSNLAQQTEETRRNLRAIEKNKTAEALRNKLTARLGEMATRLDEITKQEVEIDSKLAELRIQFKEAIRDIKLNAPSN